MTGPPPLPTVQALLLKHQCQKQQGCIAWTITVFNHGLSAVALVDEMTDQARAHLYQGECREMTIKRENGRLVFRAKLYRITEIVPEI